MPYYTNHSNMGTDQYVWAVLSRDSVQLMIYYKHLNNMGAQHYVCIDELPCYSSE